jgi:hypothetical protein
MARYRPPQTSVFDETGEPLELGAKFYAPAENLLILLPNSEQWVKGNDFPVIDMPSTPAYSDLGEDFTPVSDNDTTGFGIGRVS